MSFTYDSALSTTRDKLRAVIRDIDRNQYLFSDEELDQILAMDHVQSDLHAAAAECWRRISQSDKLLRRAFGWGSAKLSATDRTSLIRMAQDIAKGLDERAAEGVEAVTTADDLDDADEWTTWQEHIDEMIDDVV